MWLLLLALAVMMLSLGMYRTLMYAILVVWTTVILVLSFIVGGLLTLVFMPDVPRTWKISSAWVTAIVDNPESTLPQLLLIPLVFVADVYRWILEITLFQGNPILWICVGFGLWVGAKSWYGGISEFYKQRNDEIERRRSGSSQR